MRRPVLLLSLCLLGLVLGAWTVRGPEGVSSSQTVDGGRLFAAAAPPWQAAKVATKAEDLGRAARNALDWLERVGPSDARVTHVGALAELGVDPERLKRTLRFVAETAEADAGAPAQRLEDPAFWAERFELHLWRASAGGASDDRVRLTRYLVYQVEGSLTKGEHFDTALYAVPEDEVGLTPEQAEGKKSALLRYRYDRPAVLAGVYEEGGAAAGKAFPLVYLSRQDALQAQLQGTIEVRLGDGSTRLFNVDRPNGFPYERGASLEKQPRYWYFRPVDGVYGYGPEPARKVKLVAGASLAGDVYNLGLGQLIGLSWSGPQGRVLKPAVLGDTGGAFQPNLAQLDLLAGFFPNKEAFLAATREIPERVDAGILLLKE